MPSCDLPEHPNLDHLANQAKALLRGVAAGEPAAQALVAEFHPRPPAPFRLTAAQLVIARSYGFPSWPALRRYLQQRATHTRAPHRQPVGGPLATAADRVEEFLRLGCLVYGGDDISRHAEARAMLAADPSLAATTIHTIAAVGDVAAARAALAADPALARSSGGPHDLQPLLYLAYSRVDSVAPGHSTLEVARLLLTAGADPNAGYLWEGQYPFTALTGAFGEGEDAVNQPRHQYCLPLARLLLDAGADPNDPQTLYNRMFGADDDHLELLFEFGLGVDRGGPWYARFGPALPTVAGALEDQLLWAIEHDLPRRVALLLAHGVDPSCGRDGLSAGELAARSGSPHLVELLVAAGAEVPDPDPVQAFLGAAMSGDRTRVDELVAADPTIADRARTHEPRAIVRAAELGRLDAVRVLAERGFEVNIRPRTTALHEAAFHGNLPMVELLIALGADPDLTDTSFDSTPLGWAEHNGQAHVVEYLARLTDQPRRGT